MKKNWFIKAEISVRYFRDKEKREVYFVIVEDKMPKLAIECKWNDEPVSASLRYFKQKFPTAEAWQLSAVGKKDFQSLEGIRVCNAAPFLVNLS